MYAGPLNLEVARENAAPSILVLEDLQNGCLHAFGTSPRSASSGLFLGA